MFGSYDDSQQPQQGTYPSSFSNGRKMLPSSSQPSQSGNGMQKPASIRTSNTYSAPTSFVDRVLASHQQQAMGNLQMLRAGGPEYLDQMQQLRMNPMSTFY